MSGKEKRSSRENIREHPEDYLFHVLYVYEYAVPWQVWMIDLNLRGGTRHQSDYHSFPSI